MNGALILSKNLQMGYATCYRVSRRLVLCAIQLSPHISVSDMLVLD